MLLAFILGPMMEEYLRRALLISHGDPTGVRDTPHQRHHAGTGRAGDDRGDHSGHQQYTGRGVPGTIAAPGPKGWAPGVWL